MTKSSRISWGELALSTLIPCLAIALIFSPGYLSPDSGAQMEEARTFKYTWVHPPVMSLIWSLFLPIVSGPLGMLIFHNLLFWFSLSLTLQMGIRKLGVRLAITTAVLAFPPINSYLPMIWKDVSMSVAFMAGITLLGLSSQYKSRVMWLLANVIAFYGVSVRHNAFLAVLPVILWSSMIGFRLFRSKKIRMRTQIAVGLFAFIGIQKLSWILNGMLISVAIPPTIRTLLMYDLVGISVRSGVSQIPDAIRSEERVENLSTQVQIPENMPQSIPKSIEDLAKIYSTDRVDPIFDGGSGRFPHYLHSEEVTSRSIPEIKKVWFKAIIEYPLIYLKHRWEVTSSFLGLSRSEVCIPYGQFWDPGGRAATTISRKIEQGMLQVWFHLKDTLFYRGWLYLVIGIGFLVLSIRAGDAMSLVFSSSAVLYTLSYFIIGIGCDFRYLWWLVLSNTVVAMRVPRMLGLVRPK